MRISLCLALLSFAAPGFVAAADSPRPASRPNVIFILADDLGYGDLGCYGQKQIRTPNLDRLAAEGIRFTQCYSGSTVCAPSRCALMTGKHTGHCTVRGNALVPLRVEDVTVAEVLKGAGYSTSLIGKWGLGEPGTSGLPTRKGFDSFIGFLNQHHAHNYYPDFIWKNEEQLPLAGNVSKDGVSSQRAQYVHDRFTQEAVDFLKMPHPQPFFLYLAYTIPHANNEAGRANGNGMEVPDDAPYSDQPWPKPQKNHAAMITRLDADIGKLMKLLHEKGLDESTVIFFSSDNGPHKEGGADPLFFKSAGPLQGHKRDLFEGGIRTPMLARWTGTIRSGAVSDQVWAFWDVLPTLADLAAAKTPSGIDGISITPTLLGRGQQKQHDYLYWEFHERGSTQAVRMGDWKGIRAKPGASLQLYDLKHDLAEHHDVASEHPDVVRKIEEILKTARTESAEWPMKGT